MLSFKLDSIEFFIVKEDSLLVDDILIPGAAFKLVQLANVKLSISIYCKFPVKFNKLAF